MVKFRHTRAVDCCVGSANDASHSRFISTNGQDINKNSGQNQKPKQNENLKIKEKLLIFALK